MIVDILKPENRAIGIEWLKDQGLIGKWRRENRPIATDEFVTLAATQTYDFLLNSLSKRSFLANVKDEPRGGPSSEGAPPSENP